MKTIVLKIYDDDGIFDLCECEEGSTRVVRVIEHGVRLRDENAEYAAQYAYACGYRD